MNVVFHTEDDILILSTMKNSFRIALAAAVAGMVMQSCSPAETSALEDQKSGSIESWITTGDKASLFSKSTTTLAFSDSNGSSVPVIEIDSTQQFQTIDGFGYALT